MNRFEKFAKAEECVNDKTRFKDWSRALQMAVYASVISLQHMIKSIIVMHFKSSSYSVNEKASSCWFVRFNARLRHIALHTSIT